MLTAPEGNAWLARGLARHAAGRIVTDALVWRIEESKSTVAVDVLFGAKTVRFEARQLIWAAPAFVLPRVWPAMPGELKAAALAGDYAPWLTANLHLADFPEERHGAPPAWDNVFYDSPGLGYVTATHQLIRRHLPGTVFTYYRALHDVAPAEGRRLLLDTPREAWAEGILGELERVHPDIRRLTTRLDIFRNGHAMRRPVPGSLLIRSTRKTGQFPQPAHHAGARRSFRVSRYLRRRSIAGWWRRSGYCVRPALPMRGYDWCVLCRFFTQRDAGFRRPRIGGPVPAATPQFPQCGKASASVLPRQIQGDEPCACLQAWSLPVR